MTNTRVAWFARLFVSSLPSPWCWPQSVGLRDFSDDERWAELGKSLLENRMPLTQYFSDQFQKAKEVCGMTTATEKIFNVQIRVIVPEDATHYAGQLWDDPAFFKCTQVGVAGDHWWYWHPNALEWRLASHHLPHGLRLLPEPVVRAVQAP